MLNQDEEDRLEREAAESWRRLVDCVILYRRRADDRVVEALRFIESRRGREAALAMRAQIKRCAKAASWDDVEKWPANDYVPTVNRDDRRGKQ